jgi:hypothetical protein
MDLAKYVGMDITKQDILNEIKFADQDHPRPLYLTPDRFRIPKWFDTFQAEVRLV